MRRNKEAEQVNKSSFTAANAFPAKMIVNKSWWDGKIHPLHLQFIPTNKCPLNCSFCSCKDRDRVLEMDWSTIQEKVKEIAGCGCKAVTITGGGEPLAHPKINEIIQLFHSYGIQIGLVTNGVLWNRMEEWDKLTWCRISISAENHIQSKWIPYIHEVPIDWAFSYVFTGDVEDMEEQLTIAINLPVTHIRVVSDIFDPHELPQSIQDDKIIYQPRTDFTMGVKKCWVSLLRPVLHVDGNYYPCCGVQYARNGSNRDMIPEMQMSSDWESIFEEQRCFDGSQCDKCYYDHYNQILALFMQKYKHENFV